MTFTTGTRMSPLPALALCLLGGSAAAQSSYYEYQPLDWIFGNDVCIGQDCPRSTYSGIDSLRFMQGFQQNILIDDTSDEAVHYNPANFESTNDWRLRFNDDGYYGRNYFAVEDASANTQPFFLEAGAPDASLVIADNGNIGIGTAMPNAMLHLSAGPYMFPSVRLDLDPATPGTDGQSWSMVATPHLLLADLTDNTIPFSLRAGAPSNSLAMSSDGSIGLGLIDPEAALHLQRSDNSAALLIEETGAGTLGQLTLRNNGITYFTLEDSSITAGNYSGRSWNFQNQGGTFRVTTAPGGPGEIEMQMDPQGNMYIKGQLYTGTGGGSSECSLGCDRVFDADYPLPAFNDHMAAIRAAGHLPAVGPTDEAGPYNLSTLTTGTLNELEKAYLYIDELHEAMSAQSRRIESLVAGQAALTERLATLEAAR